MYTTHIHRHHTAGHGGGNTLEKEKRREEKRETERGVWHKREMASKRLERKYADSTTYTSNDSKKDKCDALRANKEMTNEINERNKTQRKATKLRGTGDNGQRSRIS